MRRSLCLLLAGLFACTAVGLFLGRGVYRACSEELRDFGAPFAGTRLFWAGKNPYADAEISQTLAATGIDCEAHSVAVYPPTTFVALAPLAIWAPAVAKTLMLMGGFTLGAAGVVSWCRILQLNQRRWLVFALMIGCSPLHTAMMTANPVLLSFGAILFGTALVVENRDGAGVVLLTWAFLLKPQIGALGLAWLGLRGNWRSLVAIGLASILVAAVALVRVKLAAPESFSTWAANLRLESSSGSIAALGPLGMQRIDPAELWAALTGRALPLLVQLLGAAVFVFGVARQDCRVRDPIASARLLAVIGIALLLVGYHRAYDALLVFPCWLLLALPSAKAWLWRSLVVAALCWWLPGGGFWTAAAEHGALADAGITHWWIWDHGVVRWQNWTLLLTAAVAVRLRCLPTVCEAKAGRET
jgi:hypothetical protein